MIEFEFGPFKIRAMYICPHPDCHFSGYYTADEIEKHNKEKHGEKEQADERIG
jgi:hypothetical protein